MNSLKFRGVDIGTGVLVYGGGIDSQRDTPVLINHGQRNVVDANTVSQYINLIDIESKEIYEKDICEVMYYTPFGDKTDDFYGRFVVEKWMGQFVMVSSSGNERLPFIDFSNPVSSKYVSNIGTVLDFSNKVNVRVIGNTFLNPELMEDN